MRYYRTVGISLGCCRDLGGLRRRKPRGGGGAQPHRR